MFNVEAYQCSNCENIFFTEEQAIKMERDTEKIKHNQFFFDKKVSVCGKSLAVGIPSELVKHVNLKKEQKLK